MRKPAFIARQGQKPAGPLGYIVAWVMARETAAENARTLEILDIAGHDKVLEIGCGHGATLRRAAQRDAQIELVGIDYSEVMIRVARDRNRRYLSDGRVTLLNCESDNIPLESETFDKAFAVHTIYFWRRPKAHLLEVGRLLRPGGRFVLGFRSGDDAAFTSQFPASIYQFRSAAAVEAMFGDCGFRHIRHQAQDIGGRSMHWISALKADG